MDCDNFIQVQGFYFQFGFEKNFASRFMRRYAAKNANYETVSTENILVGKKYVLSLMKLFKKNNIELDDVEKWKRTDYWKFRINRHWKNPTKNINRIRQLHELYHSIREHGCYTPPVITEDGYIIDGVHRLCIMIHFEYEEIVINRVVYESCFDKVMSDKLRNSVKTLRSKIETMNEPIGITQRWLDLMKG